MLQPGKELKRQGSEPGCTLLDLPRKPVKTQGEARSFVATGRSFAAADCTTSAFVPQLVQEESCKFSFVSSTLTEGCDLITQSVEYAPFKRRCVGSSPTGVINRLVVQWTEQLGSNEKVLGSNPSKAEASPISSVDRARCYERRLPQVRILHGGPTSEGAPPEAPSDGAPFVKRKLIGVNARFARGPTSVGAIGSASSLQERG